MEKDLITQLNKLKEIKPDKNWKVSNKEILMNQISGSSREKRAGNFIILTKELFMQEMSFISKPIAAMALVFLLMIGGGFFSISAASEATPGSFLYTFKLVSERTQFALALNQENKLRLGVKFAERRAVEIENLANSNEHTKIEKVANDLSEEIISVQDRLSQIEANNPEGALVLAKDIESRTSELSSSLKKTKSTLSESTGSANAKLNEAIRSVEKTGLNALNTIVQKTDSNDQLTQKDLSDRVAVKLQSAKEQIAEVKDDANKVFSAGLGKSDQGIEVYQAPQKEVDDKTEEATKIIEEAEELLGSDNYKEALERINASQELIDEAVEVSKKAQEEQEGVEDNSTSTDEVVEEGEVKGVIEVVEVMDEQKDGGVSE